MIHGKQSRLDRVDRRIIDELRLDGRLSVAALSRRVGISKTPCQLRLKRLIETGFIKGFRAIIDFDRIGEGHIAFAQVKLTNTTEEALGAFRDAVMQVEEIEECHMIAGSFDYLLKIRTADIQGYRAVLGDSISTLPHVASTSTFVVMESLVDQGAEPRPRPVRSSPPLPR
jgi:Lrp/AsnC family leucine-responsive transcriptional regulator